MDLARHLSFAVAQCLVLIGGLTWWGALPINAAAEPEPVVNGSGMRMVPIPAGTFTMGEARNPKWQEQGLDWDEGPAHSVTITRPFHLSATEVTNAQYEEFDPSHRKSHQREYRRLKMGDKDDDPVTLVTWNEAVAYCEWLSAREGQTYRLPTEAEWEYACRAGTTTAFSTGAELAQGLNKRNDSTEDRPEPVDSTVGLTPANPWRLHDMHGNVEEWVADWYGPYMGKAQSDPVGAEDGIYKVTRGGSHNTGVAFLRSANRAGALPDDKSPLIGFRVAMGPAPQTAPTPAAPFLVRQEDVRQQPKEWEKVTSPVFVGPVPYIVPPAEGQEPPVPLMRHNHSPSLTWCPNGDLLVVWFSTKSELGRELSVLGSRLRDGATSWDPAFLMAKVPDRNMHGFALGNQDGKLVFVEGINAGGRHDNIALACTSSDDSGATWSRPRMVLGDHVTDNFQCASGLVTAPNGRLLLPFDGKGKPRSTRLLASTDGGTSWKELTDPKNRIDLKPGATNSLVAGWHANVAVREDGSLYALGRESAINGKMPQSVSMDGGATWTVSPSPFPAVGTSQRMLLLQLVDGPLLLASFTDDILEIEKNEGRSKGLETTDADGKKRRIYGLFTALSDDGGGSWHSIKPLTPGGEPKEFTSVRNKTYVMDNTHSSPNGYLAGTQTPDGLVHLVTSELYFKTNLAWLRQPMPAEKP